MTDIPGQLAWRAGGEPIAAAPESRMPEALWSSAVQMAILSRSGRFFLTVPRLAMVRRRLERPPGLRLRGLVE